MTSPTSGHRLTSAPHDDSLQVLRAVATLTRRVRSIAITAVLVATVIIAAGTRLEARYDATAILLAGQSEGLAELTSIQSINLATQSLARMATDRVVMDQTIRRERLDGMTADDLAARVESEVPPDTQQIVLRVRDSDPERARTTANAIATTFSRLVEERAAAESNLSVSVWQRASTPRTRAFPDMQLVIAFALFAALVSGLLVGLLRERLDTRWRSADDVEAALDLPVMALVPTARRRLLDTRRGSHA